MAKTEEQKYRFKVVDGWMIFESRYYAQKYIDNHFMDLLKFGEATVEKRDYGFVIVIVKALTLRIDML